MDSDALIALALEKDPNHEKAKATAIRLLAKNFEIIFPDTVFPEAITSLVRAANEPQKAHIINKQLQAGVFQVEYVDKEILSSASRLFEKTESKQNTFFDSIVVATAEKLGTKTIFSFDNWYPKLGFTLASNI